MAEQPQVQTPGKLGEEISNGDLMAMAREMNTLVQGEPLKPGHGIETQRGWHHQAREFLASEPGKRFVANKLGKTDVEDMAVKEYIQRALSQLDKEEIRATGTHRAVNAANQKPDARINTEQ
jgi:hypothetical protein